MKLNLSFKYNTLIGIVVSTWVFFFLFLTRPFKQHALALSHLFVIALGMGFIIFICYFITIVVQSKIYSYYGEWTLKYESMVIALFSLLLLILSFIYYKSDYTNGSYPFLKYVYLDFIPSLIIILPLLLFLRRFITRYIVIEDSKQPLVVIQGENKLDYLKIKKKYVICASISQNYTEIYYLRNNNLESKLMRIPLKKIESICPFLIRVHRSHLINPESYIGFKDKKTISLTHIDVPISKTYKDALLEL